MLTSSAKPIAKKGLESTASCYFFSGRKFCSALLTLWYHPPNHLYNINNNTLSFSLLYLHTDISPFQTMSAANHRLLFIIYHWVCTSHLKGKDDPLLIVDYCHYTDAMMLNSSRYHQNYDKTINKIIYFMLSFEPDTWQVHSPPSGGGSSLKPPPPSPSTTVAWWKKKVERTKCNNALLKLLFEYRAFFAGCQEGRWAKP